MSTAPVAGRIMRDSEIIFGADEYTAQIRKAVLMPDVPMQQTRTLVPDGVISDVDDPVWTLQLEGLQDWRDGVGFARYLTDNSGTAVTATITPRVGGVTATVEVILKAVAFGGTRGDWEAFETELPCNGQPTFDESGS